MGAMTGSPGFCIDLVELFNSHSAYSF